MEGLSFMMSPPHQGEVFLGLSLCVLPGSGAPLEVPFNQTCGHKAAAVTQTEGAAGVSLRFK